MVSVNIVTSDRGWILERLASEITSRLDYVRHTDNPDPDADINYYVTYSCWTARVSRVEVGWFAHLEPLGEAHDKFFKAAAAMDHCLVQARLYEDLLRDRGISEVTTISPGVDLERFTPKLKIGVVGRAYHTGRKGEHLVGQLVAMPEVEWHFTGTGWPGPALELPDEDMPGFYRDMDYILVPSLYEGGPMCVVEALASGTEVISSPVGWVPDFPHIAFETGNVDDLRRVLLDLYAKKNKLRATVLDRTWDAWAARHDTLFQALAAKHPELATARGHTARARAPQVRIGRAGLLMHGNEASSQGGPSVRVPRTARELNRIEVRAEALSFNDTDLSRFDLVHSFNVWAPQSALKALRQARRQRKTSVFSPIFLDLSERPFWDTALLNVFRTTEAPEAIDVKLAELAQRWTPVRLDPATAEEPVGGYLAMVREMIQLADHVILLSDKERELLTAIGAELPSWSIVHNPTDNEAFKAADPNLFGETYGLKNFVLCVGRVEARKNQLMLAHALRDTGIPLVLIGHTPSKEYRELIERHGGDNVHFLGRLQAGSDLLLSAFRAARVATLPSWSEGAPLAALEASAAGAALVLSDRSSEPEYFGSFARYADPADPQSIRQAILDAYEAPRPKEMRDAQVAHVAANFSWAAYTLKTKQAYEKALAVKGPAQPEALPPAVTTRRGEPEPIQRIVLDLTTSVGRRGRWTGIARVEASLALELARRPDIDLRFVHWDNKQRRFLDLPFAALQDEAFEAYREPADLSPFAEAEVEPGAVFLVAGSGWMQNAVYAEGTVAFARRIEASFTVVIHDLIPVMFPYWFNDDYVPVFERNMRAILGNADRIVAISETTKQDVETVLRRQIDLDIDVVTFREGDQIGADEAVAAEGPDRPPPNLERFAGTDFVIAVGAIHARKNHKILYDVWVRLAEQLGGRCPTLLIIGGVAWNGTDLARSIKSDRRLHGRIVLLDDVDDAGLGWLYRNCIFTAYPSLYEGWGLPVCESLRYGKICLASNASSIREIAPDVTDLLDPLDFAAWFTRIRFYATSLQARRKREAAIREGYRPTSWSEAAAELAGKLRAPPKAIPQRARYHFGAPLSFVAGQNLRLHTRGLWHISESWGAWSAGKTVGIEFFLPTRPTQDLILAMRIRAVPPVGGRLEIGVSAGGRHRATWTLHNQVPQVRFVAIDRGAIGADGLLRVDFTNAELFTVAQTTKATTDLREVGLGVHAAILAETGRAATLRASLDPKNECDEPIRPGDHISLIDGRRAQRMIGGDWQKSSAWGLWPDTADAKLYALFETVPPRDVTLRFTARAVATASQPLSATVLANDTEIATWDFASSEMVERDVVVPAAAQALRQPVELRVVADARCSPLQRGTGQEERPVSLGLFDVAELAGTAPALPQAGSVPLLEIGEALLFKPNSQSRSAALATLLLMRGWYGVENAGVWSRGTVSELAFRLDRMPDSGVLVYVSVRTLGTRQSGPMHLTIDVNGRFKVDHILTSDGVSVVPLDLPADAVDADRLVWMTFRNDRALAPSGLGKSKDDRLLGIQLSAIETESAFVVQPSRAYAVGADSQMDEVFQEGWHPAEPAGRWSKPTGGHLRCVVDAGGLDRATLVCTVRVYGSALEGQSTVEVLSDGAHLATWTFLTDETVDQVLTVPLQKVGERSMLDLTFARRGALSPANLGLGEDTRELGLWIGGFELLAGSAERLGAGQRAHLLSLGPDRSLLRGAWEKAAGWGAWPAAPAAGLVLALDPAGGSDQRLGFVLRPVATATVPRTVAVLVNRMQADTWRFSSADVETRHLTLPANACDGRPVEITFVPTEPPASPADLSLGREDAAFAFGIYELVVMPGAAHGPVPSEPTPLLGLDENLSFHIGATAQDGTAIAAFLLADWFPTESTGVWTRGRSATMAFTLGQPIAAPMTLTVSIRAIASWARPANLSVLIDDVAVLATTVTDGDWHEVSADIPASAFGPDGRLCLRFASDRVVSPSSGGRSADDRPLGLQIARLKISPTLKIETGRPYSGASDPTAAAFCVEGWHYPEESGLWSTAEGRLCAVLTDAGLQSVMLSVALRVFGTERTGPAEVDLVGPDGKIIELWLLPTDNVETRTAIVPVSAVGGVAMLDVTFRRRGAISPSALGIPDQRVLGVWISSLELDLVEAPASALREAADV